MAENNVLDNENLTDCVFCGIKVSKQLLDTVHHNIDDENLCDLYQCICPNKCDIEDPVIIKNHLRVCSNQPTWCPYSSVGCLSDTVPRGEMESHLSQQGYQHAEIMLHTISNVINSVHKLESIIESMKSDQDRLKSVEEELERLKNDNIDLQRQIEENKAAGTVKEEETERNTCSIDFLSRKLDSCDLKYEKKHFEFVWRVPNFQSLVTKAEDEFNIISNQFVTFRNGYKFQMILYPNGIGPAKNQYVSLCYQLIKNKFDDLLSWPFKYNVELSLLNQVDSTKDVVSNIFYDPSDVDMVENYKRPLSDDVRMYSCLMFVSKAVLARDPNLRKNDTLFIRFCAKPVNLVD